MRIASRYRMVACAALALMSADSVGNPTPAQAQFGINIGGFPIGIHLGGYRHGRYGRSGRQVRRGGRDDAEAGNDPRPGKEDKVAVSKGAPSSAEQTSVLKKIASSTVVADVGSTKDLSEVGQQSVANDRNRDYTSKIKEIIERFKEAQSRARDTTPGDVTALALEPAIEKSVKNAKLAVCERFSSIAPTPTWHHCSSATTVATRRCRRWNR